MKKILFFAFLLLPIKAFTQPGQGDFIVSGKFSYEGNKQERFNNGNRMYHDTQNSFTIAVDAMYFLTDRISAGIFDRQKFAERINNNEEVSHDNINTLGLTGRFYLTGGKGGVFLNGYAGLHFGKNISPGEQDAISGFYTAVAPAVYYYITNGIAIEAQIGIFRYDRVKTQLDGANFYIIDSGVSAGLSPSDILIGLSFKF